MIQDRQNTAVSVWSSAISTGLITLGVLAPHSSTTPRVCPADSGSVNASGNLQVLYAGFRGEGVFESPNQGRFWNRLLGNIGDPLIRDADRRPPPALAVTAFSDVHQDRRAFRAGFDAYLRKPVELRAITDVVRRLGRGAVCTVN